MRGKITRVYGEPPPATRPATFKRGTFCPFEAEQLGDPGARPPADPASVRSYFLNRQAKKQQQIENHNAGR